MKLFNIVQQAKTKLEKALPKVSEVLYFVSSQVENIVPLAEGAVTLYSFTKKKESKELNDKIKKGRAYVRTIVYTAIMIDRVTKIIKSNKMSKESKEPVKTKFEYLSKHLWKIEIKESPTKFKFEVLGKECIFELIRIINQNTESIITKGVYLVDYEAPNEERIKRLPVIIDDQNIKQFHFHFLIDGKETILYADGREIFFNAKNSSDVSIIIEFLRKELIKRVLERKNSKDNFFFLQGHEELEEHQRRKVLEIINQVNVEELESRIYAVLKNGRKQGCILVGKPGTGKSLVIKKIEEKITEYPFLYLQPHHFSDSRTITNTFAVIKLLQPVIVIMEDLDGYQFKTKNASVSAFINLIDDINNDLNTFFIATVNNTKNVHQTIIERPGRFDYLLELLPPTDAKGVYDVAKSKFDSLKYKYKEDNAVFPDFEAINKEKLEQIAKLEITQAHISFLVVEKMFLELDDITSCSVNEFLSKCLLDYSKQKEIMAKYRSDDGNEYVVGLQKTKIG